MFSFINIKEQNLNKAKKNNEENHALLDGITRHIKGLSVNNLNKTSPIITKMILNKSNKNNTPQEQPNEINEEIINKNNSKENIKISKFNFQNENIINSPSKKLKSNGIDLTSLQIKLKNINVKNSSEMHSLLNNKKNLKGNEEIINFLYNLQPFSNRLINTFPNSQEEIIKKVSSEYHSKNIQKNSIIYKYGDEADKFYIIHEGKVDLIFPYTETIEMNKDEFFIYLLRLRRFNEIEMLHNVLLMNQTVFLENLGENFIFDNWIIKAYNTLIKLQYDPHFIDRTSIKKKKKKLNAFNPKENINFIDFLPNYKKNNNKNENKFEEKVFENRKMKELILRISDELILTIKLSFPDLYKEVKVDIFENNRIIVNLPIDPKKIELINNVKTEDYINRIKPPILETGVLRKKVIVMKYLYIKTISNGEHFGDILNDNTSLFSSAQLSLIKKSNFNFKLHQFPFFRRMTAIAKNEDNNYIGYINRKTYYDTLRRFSEKFNYEKNSYLLNCFIFKEVKNPNLIKTYSFCFNEIEIKENEFLISQNQKLNEDNRIVYIIKNGEFQSKCNKSIEQIDEVITNLGYGNQLYITLPKNLIDLIDTPYYDNIIKQKFNMKLGYVTSNDIIGLTELFDGNYYFNDYICTSKTANLYAVNFKIMNLLIKSDSNINNCKNIILYNKYKILSESLLKQRQIFFSCYFQKERDKLMKIKSEKKMNKTKYNRFSNLFIKKVEINEEPNLNSIISSIGELDKMLSKMNGKIVNVKNKYSLKNRKLKKEKDEKRNKSFIKENKYSQSVNDILDYKTYKEILQMNSHLRRIIPNELYNKKTENEKKNDKSNEKNNKQNIIINSSSKKSDSTLHDDFSKVNNSKFFYDLNPQNKVKFIHQRSLFDITLNKKEKKLNNALSDRIYIKNKSYDKITGHGLFKQNDYITLKLRRMYSSKLDKILYNEYSHSKIFL